MYITNITRRERQTVRKLLEDIYSHQMTSCVQSEKEKEEQGVGGSTVHNATNANARITMPR